MYWYCCPYTWSLAAFNVSRYSWSFVIRGAKLELEEVFQNLHGLFWIGDGMADSATVFENLIIVTTLVRLIAEKMDGGKVDARKSLLCRQMLQTVSLVPAGWKDVKRDLAADRVSEMSGKSRMLAQNPTSVHNPEIWPSERRPSWPGSDAVCHTPQMLVVRQSKHCVQWGTR